MIQEIINAGWVPYESKFKVKADKRQSYEKGNYWMSYDGTYSYTGEPYLHFIVKDPVEHMDSVGDNIGQVYLTCKYKGVKTLDAIDELFF